MAVTVLVRRNVVVVVVVVTEACVCDCAANVMLLFAIAAVYSHLPLPNGTNDSCGLRTLLQLYCYIVLFCHRN